MSVSHNHHTTSTQVLKKEPSVFLICLVSTPNTRTIPQDTQTDLYMQHLYVVYEKTLFLTLKY